MMKKQNFEKLMKLVIVGDSGVGKSCMLLRFTDKKFHSEHDLTIGVEFGSTIIISQSKKCKLQIWDTAGQESFRSSIPRSYYRDAEGIFICFDCTRKETFQHILRWFEETKTSNSRSYVVWVLVACKCDLEHRRVVTYDEATFVATHMGMQYVEVSSKTGTGVEDAFQIMTEKIAEKNACKNLHGRSMPIREMLWFRNSSESFVMHGANSWLNKLNINGLYIPETSDTFCADKILGTLGYYWFRNISTSTTTMVYRDKRWMICKRSKLLAFIECLEPFVFPYDSRLRKWREVYFSGALFDWSTSRHSMYISIEKENSKTIFGTGQRNKIVEKYSASENEEYIDIDKFSQCSKEPECIGFNISLFVRYCQVKLAVLAFEFNDSKEILDISLMESIQHKREVMESTCRELLATITPSPLELSIIELSYEDVLRALASLIEDATALFDHLTDMENGNFTMATKCRKTIQELKAHEVTLRDKLVAINVAELLHSTGASKGAGSDEVLNQLEDFLFNE